MRIPSVVCALILAISCAICGIASRVFPRIGIIVVFLALLCPRVFASLNLPGVTCAVHVVGKALFQYDAGEYGALLARVDRPQATATLWRRMLHTFVTQSHRMTAFDEGYFVRGVLLTSQSAADVQRAINVLQGDDAHLALFAGRLAYAVRKFDQGVAEFPDVNPYAGMHAALGRLDATLRIHRHMETDATTGAVTYAPLDGDVLQTLHNLDLPVAAEPVLGLSFHNGRAFELDAQSWSAAETIALIFRPLRNETLLGLGAAGVRQFLPINNFVGRRLTPTPPTANLLSALVTRRGSFLQVRHVRNFFPHEPVALRKIVDLLQGTIERLHVMHPTLAFAPPEIVILDPPGMALGGNYTAGWQRVFEQAPLYPLLEGGEPVRLPGPDGAPLPVRLRYPAY